jgi:hypothetical protein
LLPRQTQEEFELLMASQSQDPIQTDSDSEYVLRLLANLQNDGKIRRLIPRPSSDSVLHFNFGADESIKSAAEVELVKAYVSDPNRLLYILVDIGDRCSGP